MNKHQFCLKITFPICAKWKETKKEGNDISRMMLRYRHYKSKRNLRSSWHEFSVTSICRGTTAASFAMQIKLASSCVHPLDAATLLLLDLEYGSTQS